MDNLLEGADIVFNVDHVPHGDVFTLLQLAPNEGEFRLGLGRADGSDATILNLSSVTLSYLGVLGRDEAFLHGGLAAAQEEEFFGGKHCKNDTDDNEDGKGKPAGFRGEKKGLVFLFEAR